MERVRLKALAFGGCLSLLAAASSFVPAVWSWEEGIDLHILFRARGARAVPEDVVLVPIDRMAARRLFLPESAEDFERCRDVRLVQALPGYRNPDPPDVLTRWPRCLHARALNALSAARPDVVIMDISFRPRSDPGGVFDEQDRELAAAMRAMGKVVLALKIKSERDADERAQPVAAPIEAAALALAPFLLHGDQLQRADKYCAFKEDGDWTGPCLPTIANQVTALAVYPRLRDLLQRSAAENVDLIPAHADGLLAGKALVPSIALMRHLATSDPRTPRRLRALLASERTTGSAKSNRQLQSLGEIYLGAGIRYFNFYGPPGAFATLRYEALAAGPEALHPAPDSLRGKAVFIGFAEYEQPEASDHFATPFTTDENIKLSGVELAATAYANLLDGSAIVTAARWQRALIALSLGVTCALLFATTSLPLATLMCALLWVAYLGAALTLFKLHALWLPILVPLGLSIPVVAGSGLYLELKRQLDHTRRALSALLPARLVERIIRRNEALTQLSESVVGCCVVTDLQHYSALFENHADDEMARILNTYFQALFPVVQRAGGETIDIVGDSMLAVWASRDPDPMLRERACLAALQLASASDRFSRTNPDPSLRGRLTRIGVEYGRMTMGMVGSALHLEYRPVGEPPNIATRLQELGSERWLNTQLLVSESVIAGLDRFLARDLGLFALRNIPHPTRVYELMGERASVADESLALRAAFGSALADYQAGRYKDAQIKLEQLLRDHPEGDGPSRYYRRLCAEGGHYGAAPIPISGEPLAK